MNVCCCGRLTRSSKLESKHPVQPDSNPADKRPLEFQDTPPKHVRWPKLPPGAKFCPIQRGEQVTNTNTLYRALKGKTLSKKEKRKLRRALKRQRKLQHVLKQLEDQ